MSSVSDWSASSHSSGSDHIPRAFQRQVGERDGYQCIFCGRTPHEVVHIATGRQTTQNELLFVQQIAARFVALSNDSEENLICLCITCHQSFKRGCFAFVPALHERGRMAAQEEADFDARQRVVDAGGPDPGRTLLPDDDSRMTRKQNAPQTFDQLREIEFVPVKYAAEGVTDNVVHNSTKHDPALFGFDFQDDPPCRLLHFPANFYCLLAEAGNVISTMMPFSNARCDAARRDVRTLYELYMRKPTMPSAEGSSKAVEPSPESKARMEEMERLVEHKQPRALENNEDLPPAAQEGFTPHDSEFDEQTPSDSHLRAYRAEASASSSSVASYQHRYGNIQKNETYRFFTSLDYIKAHQGLEPHLFPGPSSINIATAIDSPPADKASEGNNYFVIRSASTGALSTIGRVVVEEEEN